MHRYIGNTEEQRKVMLESFGAKTIEDVFSDIPEHLKFKGLLDLEGPYSELELTRHMKYLEEKNIGTDQLTCFLGAGAYDHYIPSLIKHIVSRAEFLTSYTPYQAEISQGTLQAIFEYQTMITDLTGMEVTNASMYDGPTAAAEGCVMASENARKDKIIISKTASPDIMKVCKTILEARGIEVVEAPIKDGVTDLEELEKMMDSEIAGVLIQSPNFFGNIEDLAKTEPIVHSVKKASLLAYVDPLSLGALKNPGELGADIVVGDGQGLGVPMSFGGPHIGFLATDKKSVRKMPGRVVGQSTDSEGKRGFVLTLQAREQHIRRYKATSNICSNQGLIMVMTAIYMSTMGKEGIKEVAEQCIQKSHYAFEKLTASGKFKPLFPGKPFFKEFALKTDIDVEKLNEELLKNDILGGYELGKDFKEYKDGILFCVTEKRTKEEIDELVRIMEVI